MSMSKFVVLRNIHIVVKGHVTSIASSPAYNLFYYLQNYSFSSSSSLKFKDQNLFRINYLIHSCGLTPERAVSASKHLKFKTADKPNAVLTFFENQGFTQTQISKLIHSFPTLLQCNPEKTYLPKIEFLKSKGISLSEVAILVTRSPKLLAMSLENCLIPFFNFFSNILKSEENANKAFKHFLEFPSSNVEKHMEPNIKLLKQAGVPVRNITLFVSHHTRAIMNHGDRFRRVLEEVKEMGFDPQDMNFLLAIQTLLSMTKSTWDRKINVYKQWGWSDDDIVMAFQKSPYCMRRSEDKINSVMEHWVNIMGLKSPSLAYRPHIIASSLEKRIVPRSLVYQVLVSKGLLKPCGSTLTTFIQCTDKTFAEKIIRHYGNEAPELLKLYREKLDVANVKIDSS